MQYTGGRKGKGSRMRVAQFTVLAAQELAREKFTLPQVNFEPNRMRVAHHTVRAAQTMAGSGFYIPKTNTSQLYSLNRRLLFGSEFRFEIPPDLDEKILQIIESFYDRQSMTMIYAVDREQSKKSSLSTTRVRQRLCNLMGTDVIRLNDKRYFQKLSERLQEEYESEMDKEEDARVASENERLRRLMLEGVIENPHDYRAIIHGEHIKHKRMKKKKRRSKRKKRIDSAQETDGATTMTSQLSDEEGEKEETQDEIVTQVEILTRPSSSAGTKSRQRGSAKKDRKTALEEKDEEKENEDERLFSEMHVPPPHRPSSSCSLRRKRLKSAAPRVSHWDNNRHSSEESEQESDTETKSLPDPRRTKDQWKYNKTEKPLVKTLRREETVAGLYAIAEELISPVKTETDKKVIAAYKPKKKKMTVMY